MTAVPPGSDDPCMNEPAPSKRSFPRVSLIALALALATLVNYLVWLGWDQQKDIGPDGSVSGPYQSWQVIGLILTMVLITAVAGWCGHPWVAGIVTAAVLTLCWSVDAATDADSDGLWPVGAVLVAVGSFIGLTFVAHLAAALRGIRR